MIYPKEDLQAKIDCIAAYPEVRYVLITGGDALALSDNYLDWIAKQLEQIPHIELMRLDSRMICTLPQWVIHGFYEILSRHKPINLNTQSSSPKELTPEVEDAVDWKRS